MAQIDQKTQQDLTTLMQDAISDFNGIIDDADQPTIMAQRFIESVNKAKVGVENIMKSYDEVERVMTDKACKTFEDEKKFCLRWLRSENPREFLASSSNEFHRKRAEDEELRILKEG